MNLGNVQTYKLDRSGPQSVQDMLLGRVTVWSSSFASWDLLILLRLVQKEVLPSGILYLRKSKDCPSFEETPYDEGIQYKV